MLAISELVDTAPARLPVANTSERWLPGGRGCILDLMSEVTQILSAIERGDSKATEELLPVVYGELRKLAAAKLKEEQPGQTLQPTALVHEAYLRLVGSREQTGWDGRGHFFAAAAEAMRRILIDNARRKKRIRHGGDLERRSLLENDVIVDPLDDRLLTLDAALSQLLVEHPAIGELVKLRYFGGLTTEQAARALKVSSRTAKRHWAFAKAWLRREIDRDGLEDRPT